MTDTSFDAADLERRALDDVAVDEGWDLVERFSELVRESGSEAEREAARYISGHLDRLGVPHEVLEAELYLSLPREAAVETDGRRFQAKPPSFSRSTGPEGLEGEPIYVPARPAEGELGDLFGDRYGERVPDVEDKIVVTEGLGLPLSVRRFEEAGARAQIYVNPGDEIHWGICTPVWGTPTDEDLGRVPSTPVVSINRPDGKELLEGIRNGTSRARVFASLEEGWFTCPLPVATIEGASDDFLLVHGHYDSWDVGVGDNAVGDATLLELARIFHGYQDRLRRSLRIAWWPGHSTGRYAGSTWYADRFASELSRRCVATVNIDSPGCWKATAYDSVAWMAECEAFCRRAIRDATGQAAQGRRPPRAGDYSFGQIGLTSFFMLLSEIPEEERKHLGFYPVGGCGGNVAWHTENDRLPVADRENLERDLRVYVAAVSRVLSADVLPFDYRRTLKELDRGLAGYEASAESDVGLGAVRRELDALRELLGWLYRTLERGELDARTRDVNETLKRLARRLVPLAHGEEGRFRHDPALPRPPFPALSAAGRLPSVRQESPETLPFLRTRVRRRANHAAEQLWGASEAVRRLRDDAPTA